MDDIVSDVLTDVYDGSLTPGYDRSQAARSTDEESASLDDAAVEGFDYDIDGDADEFRGPARRSKKIKPTQRKLRKITVDLPTTTLVHPRSVFDGFVPPAPLTTESAAIQSLLRADPTQEKDDFIEFELEDFACYIYKDNKTVPFEMRGLHMHACKSGDQHFYFDGVLRVGTTRHYVHKVAFEEIPLGNYGTQHSSVGDQIWIQSRVAKKTGKPIYYRLNRPAMEYARFHTAFLWVADLAKHVADFCENLIQLKSNIALRYFKERFAKWLRQTHKSDPVFLQWYKQRRSNDFRQSIVANQAFIHKEVFSILGNGQFRHVHLFQELESKFYKRIGSAPVKDGPVPHTIVTPYIYEMFSHMLGLDQLLKAVEPTIGTEERIKRSWPKNAAENLRFTRGPLTDGRAVDREVMIHRIEAGDLISTPPDDKLLTETKWRTERPDKKWFGLVQKVHTTKTNKRSFDVIWIYQPDDTPCCVATYPWTNELFLSDHCTCHGPRVAEDQVLGVHSVEWFGSEKAKTEFFVRLMYTTTTEARRFVTLQKGHLLCNHNKEPGSEHHVGDTVLVLTPGKGNRLEPFELLEYLNGNKTVRLRRLRRRREFDCDCTINELVYTEEELVLPATKIVTRCIVRFYTPGQDIPAPYNRQGAGNAFIITHRLRDDGTLEPLTTSGRPRLRQGFDPARPLKKLRSLDLFCGCGNFGRGVEDAGAVSAKWANDIKSVAIHTYMSNVDDPDDCHPFLGSIDDLLQCCLEGRFSEKVPQPGEVDVVLGGSPCQGFSLLNMEKDKPVQFKNRSLVASFAAVVDYLRPAWGILENVTKIVRNGKKHRDTEDYFSQLICALVGMGYQVEIILGDAWSHGSPQRRARAFLYFAAPGARLPKSPYPSHSNPSYVAMDRIGKMTNEKPYVQRSDRPTAFEFVSAREATADLPDIYDAQVDTCIPFPDHRLSISMSSGNTNGVHGGRGMSKRPQLLNIPIGPYGVNFSKAYYRRVPGTNHGDMFLHERDAYPLKEKERGKDGAHSWGRAHPHQLFSTITTACHPSDARIGGRLVHWEQSRVLSIMEVRRAQGIPDGEVLLGTPGEQWGMVGNGVARGISMALGLSLREAWLGSLYEDESPGQGQGQLVDVRGDIGDVKSHLEQPWATANRHEWGAGAGQGTQEAMLHLPLDDSSRSASHTPAVSEAELGNSRFYSTTPATSLAEADELLPTPASSKGKRPLSKVDSVVCLGRNDTTATSKRPKLGEELPRYSGYAAPKEAPARQVAAKTIPVFEENDDGELVLLGGSGPLDGRPVVDVDADDDEELTLVGEYRPPAHSASGLTVVRMSSVDLLNDGYEV